MSKIDNYNLILQEQAEELGFSTTQEAFDNGYEVVEKQNGEPYLAQFLSAEDEQEEAHKAWLKEKEECIRKLELTLENVDLDDVDHVQDAIDFIKGVKYES